MLEVLTRPQALAVCSGREVDAHVRSGRWLALRRGVYLTGPELPADPQLRHAALVQAAVLAAGTPCVGSHESAAVLHGLPLVVPYDGLPRVSRCRDPGRPAARACAPLVSTVPPEQRVLRLGAPVTSLARTAVDLARTSLPLTAVAVLDAALRAGAPLREVQAVLDGQQGWPGVAVARQRVAFADPRAETALESVSRLRFAQLELPPPRLQVVLGDVHRAVGRVDFYWEEFRTVGEADGRLKYAAPADLFAEKQREDALRDAGNEVFRWTWDEAVHRPEVLRERALRCFARGQRRR